MPVLPVGAVQGDGVPRRCAGKLSQLSLPVYLLSYITGQLPDPCLKAAAKTGEQDGTYVCLTTRRSGA